MNKVDKKTKKNNLIKLKKQKTKPVKPYFGKGAGLKKMKIQITSNETVLFRSAPPPFGT